MADLFSLLSPEDQQKTREWAAKRRQTKYNRDIPPELYLAAQLGYYYGWQAVVDFRRGYHIGIDVSGKKTKLSFTFAEASAFVEAAQKVHYRQMMDASKSNAAATVSSYDKEYAANNAAYVNELQDRAYQ